MKQSFRETQPALAAEVRKFIDRRLQESERGDLAWATRIGALLSALDEALDGIPDGFGGVLADDPAFRRKAAALKVRFEALRALELRALAADGAMLPEDTASDILGILCTKLYRDAGDLTIETLGYYALPLPDERPGDNEAPLGGAYARSARQGMLAGLLGLSGTLDAQRDRLARKLLKAAGTGETGAGH